MPLRKPLSGTNTKDGSAQMSKKGPHGSVSFLRSFRPYTIRSKSVEVGAVLLEARIHHLVTGTYPSWDRRMPIEVARTKKANGLTGLAEDETQRHCSQP